MQSEGAQSDRWTEQNIAVGEQKKESDRKVATIVYKIAASD